MSCCLIKALGQKRFDFGYLGAAASQSITLVPVIESCDYGWAAIYVRVHERTMVAGQTLKIQLFNVLPCETDGREFIETQPVGGSGLPEPILSVTVSSALPTAIPGIYYNSVNSPGPYLKLALTATQAGAGSNFYTEISVLILMRETA